MKKIAHKLAAIIPIYDSHGQNCTKLVSIKGQERTEAFRVRTVMARIFDYYCMNGEAYRKKMHRILGKKQVPVKFGPDQIYIYVKLRQPIGRDDGAFGWVNYCEIDQVLPKAEGLAHLRLASGYDLPTLESPEALERKLRLAQLVDEILPNDRKDTDFDGSPHRPATQKDILRLLQKMEGLEAILLNMQD